MRTAYHFADHPRIARRVILNDVQPICDAWSKDELDYLYNAIAYFHAGEIRIKYAEEPSKDFPIKVDIRVTKEKTFDLRRRLIHQRMARAGQVNVTALKDSFDRCAHHTHGNFNKYED